MDSKGVDCMDRWDTVAGSHWVDIADTEVGKAGMVAGKVADMVAGRVADMAVGTVVGMVAGTVVGKAVGMADTGQIGSLAG